MKNCTRCGEKKDLNLFNNRKKSKDGKTSHCIECHKSLYKGKNKYKDIDKRKEYEKKYRDENKEKLKSYISNWYIDNKENVLGYQKKYSEQNKDKINEYRRKRNKERLLEDDLYKFKRNIRNRTKQAFKKTSWKKEGSEMLLGCDFETAKNHIEKQFICGMNWENHGEWHIDHIIPLSKAKTKDELISLCNYKNLQPLWAIDNLIKWNR